MCKKYTKNILQNYFNDFFNVEPKEVYFSFKFKYVKQKILKLSDIFVGSQMNKYFRKNNFRK